jgi:hypothetical protein
VSVVHFLDCIGDDLKITLLANFIKPLYIEQDERGNHRMRKESIPNKEVETYRSYRNS